MRSPALEAGTQRLGERRPFALDRVTTSGRFIPVIDGLRFLAILGVVSYHAWGYAGPLHDGIPDSALAPVLRKGWFGVELFFCISGFILALGFIPQHMDPDAKRVSLGSYLLRRLTRLEPPYLIALLVYFTAKTVMFGAEGLGPHLAASAAYLHNAIYGEGSRVLGVAWSLEVEVQFYLLVPMLTAVFRIRPTALRRATLGLLVLASSAYSVFVGWEGIHVLRFLHYFLTGFLLCDLYYVTWQRGIAIRKHLAWDVLGLACWVALWACLTYDPRWRLMNPVLVLGACVAAFRGPLTARVLSWRPIYVIGGMCYTIYLYHTLLLRTVITGTPIGRGLVEVAGPELGLVLVLIASYAATLAACTVLFVLFERPFMVPGWPRRLRQRLRGQGAAPTA